MVHVASTSGHRFSAGTVSTPVKPAVLKAATSVHGESLIALG